MSDITFNIPLWLADLYGETVTTIQTEFPLLTAELSGITGFSEETFDFLPWTFEATVGGQEVSSFEDLGYESSGTVGALGNIQCNLEFWIHQSISGGQSNAVLEPFSAVLLGHADHVGHISDTTRLWHASMTGYTMAVGDISMSFNSLTGILSGYTVPLTDLVGTTELFNALYVSDTVGSTSLYANFLGWTGSGSARVSVDSGTLTGTLPSFIGLYTGHNSIEGAVCSGVYKL